MADGAADTIPAPPLPRRVKGIQSERDGALIPDAYGEMPWPLIRLRDGYGDYEWNKELAASASRHILKHCMGDECGEFGKCDRHGKLDDDHAERTPTVAEAAAQIRMILGAAVERTATYERDLREVFIRDILEEATRYIRKDKP